MITSGEMRRIEESSGIPSIQLMENAGVELCKAVKGRFDISDKRILVVAYHGNNGGDGFVAARLLSEDAAVDVFFVGDEQKLKNDALINYKKIVKNPLIQLVDEQMVDFDDYDIIIDAVFGTGLRGSPNEEVLNAINGINSSKAFKISVDIPSGIDPDSGGCAEVFVNADLIVTFHELKKGLEPFKDKTIVADIGIKK